jgi:hypothetical protein
LLEAVRNPRLFVTEGERIVTNTIYHLSDESAGIDVMKQDWDNLIILNACRYDYFEQHNQMDESLKCVSPESTFSERFIQENFAGRTLNAMTASGGVVFSLSSHCSKTSKYATRKKTSSPSNLTKGLAVT